jgi:3-hydroxyisobutyryl-CoA hydrolase
VKKTPGRPAWSPSTLAEVSEKSILTNFFSPASPYLDPKPELSEVPEHFKEPRNPMRFSLPTQEDVRHYVMQDTPTGGGLAVTRDQVIKHFEEETHGKGGVREKVSEILDRKTQPEKGASEQNQWIRWKH